jgi:hypothetical protein
MIDVKKSLFKLGQVVATPGALSAMEEASQPPSELLARHVKGDWGDLDGDDKEANDRSVEEGTRILSAYILKTGVKVWVISEADRGSTCLLLPEEY